jgi:hypothetical protein
MNATVCALGRDAEHGVRKTAVAAIALVVGLGVEGDAHAGEQVQHLSRMRRDPTQPDLRQVHPIHAELHDELLTAGFQPIAPAGHTMWPGHPAAPAVA